MGRRRSELRTEPLVSLIMPVWRPRAEWLRVAVSGALGQVGCRTELVVVDDGCVEPVADLLHGRLDDPRLRLERVPHGGVSRARDAGIAVARGEWFRFLDADDAFPPRSTAHLLRLTGGDPEIISYGAGAFCDADLVPLRVQGSHLEGDVRTRCLLGAFPVMLPGLLFHRRVVEKTGPWDPELTVSQDWDWVLRALEHGRVRGDRTVVFYYRQYEGSASRTRTDPDEVPPGVRAARRVVEKYFARHPESRSTPLERKAARMLDALELTQRVGGGGWWRSPSVWFSLAKRPGAARFALPVLVRSSIPPAAARWLRRLRRVDPPPPLRTS